MIHPRAIFVFFFLFVGPLGVFLGLFIDYFGVMLHAAFGSPATTMATLLFLFSSLCLCVLVFFFGHSVVSSGDTFAFYCLYSRPSTVSVVFVSSRDGISGGDDCNVTS